MLNSKEARKASLASLIDSIDTEIIYATRIHNTYADVNILGYAFSTEELEKIIKKYKDIGYNLYVSDYVGNWPFTLRVKW